MMTQSVADEAEKPLGAQAGYGIARVGPVWVVFDDGGVKPGVFADADAARNGAWCSMEDIRRICVDQARPITMEDVRASMRRFMDSLPPKTASER